MATGSKFLDKLFANNGPTPEHGARRLVQMSQQLIATQQQYLENVRKIVAKHGVPALTAELGGDEATAMAAFYQAVKAMVEAAAPNIQVAELS